MSVQPCTPSTAGRVVDGRYLILERLGVGGTAIIYCAQDLVLPRTVVLKVLHEWFVGDDEIARRFQREARSASEFRHPNIVSTHGSGEWNDRRYIILEHVPGCSLKRLVRERHR
jgi:eukaryotic-like serine/threonine-protein kinase